MPGVTSETILIGFALLAFAAALLVYLIPVWVGLRSIAEFFVRLWQHAGPEQ